MAVQGRSPVSSVAVAGLGDLPPRRSGEGPWRARPTADPPSGQASASFVRDKSARRRALVSSPPHGGAGKVSRRCGVGRRSRRQSGPGDVKGKESLEGCWWLWMLQLPVAPILCCLLSASQLLNPLSQLCSQRIISILPLSKDPLDHAGLQNHEAEAMPTKESSHSRTVICFALL
ncbi:unnamed protein product [Urochloa humidicola]